MYSIKTDLGVSGNQTVNKDLMIKGSAVIDNNLTVKGTVDFANATFTQIDVTGAANLKDINSSGTANLNDVLVSGNTTIGNSDADAVTVNGVSTFNAGIVAKDDLTVQGDVLIGDADTDTLRVNATSEFAAAVSFSDAVVIGEDNTDTLTVKSTASFEDAVEVKGDTSLKGNLVMADDTIATFDDVVINGSLGGNFSIANGNFTTLNVSGSTTLKNTTVAGNLSGTGYSSTFSTYNVAGQNGVIQFSYNDPARPSDIKTSLEPYKVSSEEFQGHKAKIDHVVFGDPSFNDYGLTAKGKASVDYLDIVGNSTTGKGRAFLTVGGDASFVGNSTFGGTTTVGDLVIGGSVTGLKFSDLDVEGNLSVAGASNLKSVNLSGNITGTSSSATFATYNVAGQAGVIQFSYNDPARPSDIKSAIEPYKVSSNEFQGKKSAIGHSVVGDVTF